MKKSLPNHTIFVEGPEDSRFLQELFSKWYSMKLSRPEGSKQTEGKTDSAGEFTDCIHCGGKTKVHLSAPSFQQSTASGLQNILFLDADSLEKDKSVGGLEKTIALCKRLKTEGKISISKAFIFPLKLRKEAWMKIPRHMQRNRLIKQHGTYVVKC